MAISRIVGGRRIAFMRKDDTMDEVALDDCLKNLKAKNLLPDILDDELDREKVLAASREKRQKSEMENGFRGGRGGGFTGSNKIEVGGGGGTGENKKVSFDD